MIDIKTMTVLIVDDMMTMCQSITKMMRVIGYGKKFHHANDGLEALRVLKREPIDLMMLDYNMPGMKGGEVLSQIRESRELRDLPVIMITAEAFRDYVAEAAESTVDAYILKPLTIRLLEEKIGYVVENANNPPPMVAHLKKALEFEDAGDLDAAIQEVRLANEADPKSSRPIRDLGYYYYKKNDLKNAEKYLLKASEMNYLDVFAFHYLGEVYLERNDIEKAQHYFEKAMQISPRHLSRGIHFGKTLVQRNMITKAMEVFDNALQLSGSTVELTEEIADFCHENGALEYAAKLLESIIRENPNRKDLFYKLGKTLEGLGNTKKAITYLHRAEGYDLENLDIKISLAKCYLTFGKPIFAENTLKRALELDPDHEEARELLRSCV